MSRSAGKGAAPLTWHQFLRRYLPKEWAKRRMLALPIEERREALRKQAEALLRANPDYGVEK